MFQFQKIKERAKLSIKKMSARMDEVEDKHRAERLEGVRIRKLKKFIVK